MGENRSWIDLKFMTIQPSEFVKIVFVFFVEVDVLFFFVEVELEELEVLLEEVALFVSSELVVVFCVLLSLKRLFVSVKVEFKTFIFSLLLDVSLDN